MTDRKQHAAGPHETGLPKESFPANQSSIVMKGVKGDKRDSNSVYWTCLPLCTGMWVPLVTC